MSTKAHSMKGQQNAIEVHHNDGKIDGGLLSMTRHTGALINIEDAQQVLLGKATPKKEAGSHGSRFFASLDEDGAFPLRTFVRVLEGKRNGGQ